MARGRLRMAAIPKTGRLRMARGRLRMARGRLRIAVVPSTGRLRMAVYGWQGFPLRHLWMAGNPIKFGEAAMYDCTSKWQ